MKNVEKKSMITSDLRTKTWVGRIIENEDPLRQFRCKVRIFGLLDDIDDDLLPWFFPSGNNTFASTDNGGFGDATYPKIGTIVKVSFPFGDIYSGEYFAIQNINPTLSAELEDDYENSQIIRYDEDEELKILFTQQQGFLIHLRENIIKIDKDDNITIKNNKDDYVEILNDGNINVYANSECHIEAANVTTLEAQQIKFGDSAVEAVIKGDTFATIFDNHTHIGNMGAPTTPASATGFLTQPSLSTKVKTE